MNPARTLSLGVALAVIGVGLAVTRVHGATAPTAPTTAPASTAAATPAALASSAAAIAVVPGMPPVIDPRDLYSETAAGKLSPAVRDDLARIYVPNLRSNDVYVIDPALMKVVGRFKVGIGLLSTRQSGCGPGSALVA